MRLHLASTRAQVMESVRVRLSSEKLSKMPSSRILDVVSLLGGWPVITWGGPKYPRQVRNQFFNHQFHVLESSSFWKDHTRLAWPRCAKSKEPLQGKVVKNLEYAFSSMEFRRLKLIQKARNFEYNLSELRNIMDAYDSPHHKLPKLVVEPKIYPPMVSAPSAGFNFEVCHVVGAFVCLLLAVLLVGCCLILPVNSQKKVPNAGLNSDLSNLMFQFMVIMSYVMLCIRCFRWLLVKLRHLFQVLGFKYLAMLLVAGYMYTVFQNDIKH